MTGRWCFRAWLSGDWQVTTMVSLLDPVRTYVQQCLCFSTPSSCPNVVTFLPQKNHDGCCHHWNCGLQNDAPQTNVQLHGGIALGHKATTLWLTSWLQAELISFFLLIRELLHYFWRFIVFWSCYGQNVCKHFFWNNLQTQRNICVYLESCFHPISLSSIFTLLPLLFWLPLSPVLLSVPLCLSLTLSVCLWCCAGSGQWVDLCENRKVSYGQNLSFAQESLHACFIVFEEH